MYSRQGIETDIFKKTLVTLPYMYTMTWNRESEILQYV